MVVCGLTGIHEELSGLELAEAPKSVFNAVIVEHAPSPLLNVIDATFTPCGLSGSLKVAKKRQSASPGLGSSTQKLGAVVDEKLTDDLNSASIFGNVIGHKLYDGSSGNLYSCFRVNFANDPAQTQAPNVMDLGLPSINTLNKSGVLGTPATRIRSLTDGSH